MTREQYDRWKDFALRMARTAFKGHKRPSEAWIIDRVEQVFADLDRDPDHIAVIANWDHSEPVGLQESGYYGVSAWMSEQCYDDADHPGYFWIRQHKPGQEPKQREGEEFGAYWLRRQAHRDWREERLDIWEERAEERSGGRDREMLAHERFDEDWYGPVRCCVRAGLDLASSPSAGVVGFTVATLRTMYPEGIPEWIRAWFIAEDGTRLNLDACDASEPVWL